MDNNIPAFRIILISLKILLKTYHSLKLWEFSLALKVWFQRPQSTSQNGTRLWSPFYRWIKRAQTGHEHTAIPLSLSVSWKINPDCTALRSPFHTTRLQHLPTFAFLPVWKKTNPPSDRGLWDISCCFLHMTSVQQYILGPPEVWTKLGQPHPLHGLVRVLFNVLVCPKYLFTASSEQMRSHLYPSLFIISDAH